jgi:hypothetical protein
MRRRLRPSSIHIPNRCRPTFIDADRAGGQRDGGGEDRAAGMHQPRATFMLSCGRPASVWNTTQ